MNKIIHIDMDAFYASVEQRDNPEYRGKPIAVGGNKERGVVAAASYEARQYGVRSAMPSVTALKKCPEIIFVKPRFEVYRKVSRQIKSIFWEYTELIEPLALDEAYLDVTENKVYQPSATLLAKTLKARIKQETGLVASAGVSYNKFLAKIASDMDKPDGLKVITPQEAIPLLENLDISKFHGVGKVTAQKMNRLGIYKGEDLKKWSQQALKQYFGKHGLYFYKIVRGQDERAVNPNRIRKSIGAELTFDKDLTTIQELKEALEKITLKTNERMEKAQMSGRTITLKIKYYDFTVITRSQTLPGMIREHVTLLKHAIDLLNKSISKPVKVRLLGISVSNLVSNNNFSGQQLTFEF